ncbi:tetratricopeptide repeat protein [Aeoliella mucimassa]|uniref:Tetratricopeptide repeat protein n=1 Tax=Aeoliella mucimassa TaxID=2527972 RepID=A0A518ALR6_9BACT|nr:tetratricopeptide repeat protein [Aeoliella mucimassa]QDU55669.1 tetratricopeptide repeat protein [Aeoliella mucimassa]
MSAISKSTRIYTHTAGRTSKRRHHYQLNVRLLLITLAVLVCLCAGCFVWYKIRIQQVAEAFRERAETLQEEGKPNEAASYYQRYLLANPGNTEALLGLIKAYSEGPQSPARLQQLNQMIYRALGRDPEQVALRIQLAENLYKLGSYAEAERESQTVLESSPDDLQATKVVALSRAARSDLDPNISPRDALIALLEVCDQLPADQDLILTTAITIRDHTNISLPDVSSNATLADTLVDHLVELTPDSAEVRLARYNYQRRFFAVSNGEDLDKAFEIEPDNPNVLYYRAIAPESSLTQEQRKQLLETMLELSPQDPRGYIALADVLGSMNRHTEAIELLTQAWDITGASLQIGPQLLHFYLQQENFAAAEAILARINDESPVQLAQMNSQMRERIESHLSLLSARLAIGKGETETAVAELQKLALNPKLKQAGAEGALWAEATELLARIYSSTGQLDIASEYWEQLAERYPQNVELVKSTAAVYLQTGSPEKAVTLIGQLNSPSDKDINLYLLLLKAHLQIQSGRDPQTRNWAEFEKVLEESKALKDSTPELSLIETQYLSTTDDKAAAVATLRFAEQEHTDSSVFWRAATLLYLDLQEETDADRACKQFCNLETEPKERAKLQAILQARSGDFDAANKTLAAAMANASSKEQTELLRMRADLLSQAGHIDTAFQLVKDQLTQNNQDTELLTIGIDLALAQNDLATAVSWETTLLQLTHNSLTARYQKAKRLLQAYEQLSDQQHKELDSIVNAIGFERPRWYPGVSLSGQLHLAKDDRRRALLDFQRAVDLGDRRIGTLQQVISLLYESGRLDDAEQYLTLLLAGSTLTGMNDSMSAELAFRLGRGAAAVEMARESVALSPQDPVKRVFLAGTLNRFGQSDEAVTVLQQATIDFPGDNRVWVALFNAYFRSGKVDVAREALDSLVSGQVLPKEQRHYVAAQGYRIIGDLAQAEAQFREAITLAPSNTDIRLQYAALLSPINPAAAKQQYEKVLETDSSNSDAKRQLAILLASTGVDEDWERASTLLSTSGTAMVGGAEINDRLRALLLSQRGRTRDEKIANCQLAQEMIELLIQRGSRRQNLVNRSILARILERHASLSGDEQSLIAAGEQLRQTVEEKPPSVSRYITYIEFLLRNSSTDNTGDNAEPDTLVQRRPDYIDEADTRIQELSQLQVGSDERTETLVTALRARLLVVKGETDKARDHVRNYISNKSIDTLPAEQQAQQFLLFGRLYSALEMPDEAEVWYRRLMDSAPDAYVLVIQSLIEQGKRDEAAQLGLQVADGKPNATVAKILASLLTSTDTTSFRDPKAEEAVNAALAEHQDDVELLQADAVMRASRGDYEAALQNFRQILEINPNDALTLNNLATLLAERPNERAEALRRIDQAIQIAGRDPVLLDTKGTIHYKLGDAQSSIACLEEATSGGATDARYYLHLAAAYQLGKRIDDAKQVLQEARDYGIEQFVLTEDDKKMLTALEETSEVTGEQ